MLLALVVVVLAFVPLAIIVANLRNAPEAYEDETGFHVLKKRVTGSAVFRERRSPSGTLLEQAKLNR